MSHPSFKHAIAQFHDRDRDEWLKFENPERICEVRKISELRSAFATAESWAMDHGLYVLCMITYEAAPGFDPHLTVRKHAVDTANFPLAVFLGFLEPAVPCGKRDGDLRQRNTSGLRQGTAGSRRNCSESTDDSGRQVMHDWHPELTAAEYHDRIARVKEYIRRGDTYQVNLTQRLRAGFDCEARNFFERMIRAQQNHYGALVEVEDWAVLSASPELFFRRDGRKITTRPMKGTVSRGLWAEADLERREWLRTSQKNRAENVMIVDMMRNDLGRIAIPGSVAVPQLFEIEQYPTVWQMTSTVECDSDRSLSDIMAALFPCASITGAPKRRTMEIIAELETSPRRVYTGTIGIIHPGGDAVFNVAIRTVLLDRQTKRAEFGVGGGIVWDSTAHEEADECTTKARVLTHVEPEFDLFETLLWTPEDGFLLLQHHLNRMAESAAFFGFTFDREQTRTALETAVSCRDHRGAALSAGAHTTHCPPHTSQTHATKLRQEWTELRDAPPFSPQQRTAGSRVRVRLVLSRSGEVRVQAKTLAPESLASRSGCDGSPCRRAAVTIRLANEPVDSSNVFLYHKTTIRTVYDRAKAAHPEPEVDDVLLWNEQGFVTESTIANLVFELQGVWYTPPVADGLLAGTYRQMLLETAKVDERSLKMEDIQKCDRLFLVNSVRGMREAILIN